MSNGADHTWRRQESLGVGEGAPACAVSHVLRWGLSALGSSLGQHLAQGDSPWPALLLWGGSAPPSPSRAPLNPATAGLGCNVVTVALPEPGTCPSAPQQPPCRHRGDTHPKPWRGWGPEQDWRAWVPAVLVDLPQTSCLWGWLPQYPAACTLLSLLSNSLLLGCCTQKHQRFWNALSSLSTSLSWKKTLFQISRVHTHTEFYYR